MRRIIYFLFAALLLAPLAAAQNITAVTATITDPNGLPYSYATIQAQLIPTGVTPTINGQEVSPFTRASADINGTFSMALASNAALSPSGTQWQFTVNLSPGIPAPQGFGPQAFTVTLTISGSSQNITSALQSAALLLARAAPPAPFKGPVPWIDATTFGVRVLNKNFLNTITVTTSGGSPSVSTTGIADFQVNDGIAIPAAGNATTQPTPSAPTVTALGTSGTTTYSYRCVAVDKSWGLTAASAAGSTTTGPQVFGQGAVGISSISRSSNVVTVTASSNLPFSSGTFHAVIANITGGTTPFIGLQLVTVTSITTLTYSQTGANESGTTGASSYILFENAFVLTTVQATAGSPNLVLTTDVNHNITVGTTPRPTKIFLDGILFSSAVPPRYADGVFPVTAVTSNTITVATEYTSPVTATGAADINSSTSGVAQMTATVWALVDVTCPTITNPTVYYAVYGNYGTGYSPVGFTPWEGNIFEDYGPINSQTGFTAPAMMALPATPPASAQNQVFSGQVQSINGNTLTLTSNVPSAVTNVTANHDQTVPFLNAITAACSNGAGGSSDNGFSTVYFPRQLQLGAGAGTSQYIFNSPVDLPSTSCRQIRVIQGAPIVANGTIMGHNGSTGVVGFDWIGASDLSGVGGSAGGSGTTEQVAGVASPLMVTTTEPAYVKGIQFTTSSNGQIGLVDISGTPHTFENLVFGTQGHALTAIPFLIENEGFSIALHNINFGGDTQIEYPFARVGNVPPGQVAWWPVPAVEVIGPTLPIIKWDGQNYGLNGGGESRAIQIDWLYGNNNGPFSLDLSNVWTFQDPWQPLVTFYGAGGVIPGVISIDHVGMDSVLMPIIGCIRGAACANVYRGTSVEANNDGADPTLTGPAFLSAFETLSHAAVPVQNTNECYINGTAGSNVPMSCTTLSVNGTQFSNVSGIPSGFTPVNLTAQAISISPTTLYAVPAGSQGWYRVSGYPVLTQAATTSSTLPQLAIAWTDPDTGLAQSQGISGTSGGNTVGLIVPTSGYTFYAKASTNIQYSTASYASSGATPMQYSLHIRLEYLGP